MKISIIHFYILGMFIGSFATTHIIGMEMEPYEIKQIKAQLEQLKNKENELNNQLRIQNIALKLIRNQQAYFLHSQQQGSLSQHATQIFINKPESFSAENYYNGLKQKEANILTEIDKTEMEKDALEYEIDSLQTQLDQLPFKSKREE